MIGIAELAKIDVDPDVVRIGACARHTAFHTPAIPGLTGALLRMLVHYIAHYPIRVSGTTSAPNALSLHANAINDMCGRALKG